MIFPVHADLIGLVRGLIDGLQPFARAHDISLTLCSEFNELEFLYQPEEIIPDLTQLLCRVITFTPQGFAVKMLIIPCPNEANTVLFSVVNSGASLALMGDIKQGLRYEVSVENQKNGTEFIVRIPLPREQYEAQHRKQKSDPHSIIKPWYSEIRERLTTHFTNPRHLEELAGRRNEQDGIFLKKVNAIIERKLDHQGFSAEDLARAMALSRTQLFRRIRSLTQMAPGRYIRAKRLLRAKELLESGKHNVSEVAGQVGFVSNSHFTRAFQKQFGINPSSMK